MRPQTTDTNEALTSVDQSVHFPDGLPGLPDRTRFTLQTDEASAPYAYLQSLEDARLCFLTINPFAFFTDYDFTLPDLVRQQLGIVSPHDIWVRNIVVVGDHFKQSTVNLQAPVIINFRTGLGRQVILNNPDYTVKHKLFSERATARRGAH